MVDLNIILAQIYCNISLMQEVIGKIFLDHISFISAANNKVIISICGIYLHYMPENWSSTNLNHRLWFQVRLFTQSGSKTSGKNYYFHIIYCLSGNVIIIDASICLKTSVES